MNMLPSLVGGACHPLHSIASVALFSLDMVSSMTLDGLGGLSWFVFGFFVIEGMLYGNAWYWWLVISLKHGP